MTDVKVRRRKLSEYRPDPNNANLGSERGYRVIDDSVSQDGAGRSGLVDKNDIFIAGNQTMQAMADHGIEEIIEVETTGNEWVVVKRVDADLTDPDPNNTARRLAYRDNRSTELSLTWDAEQILADLNAGVDLSALWQEDELKALLAEITAQDPPQDSGPQTDRAAELQEKWQVETGQLWVIPSKAGSGEHRLLCGDSTKEGDVRELGVDNDTYIFTDPPYGIAIDTTWLSALNMKRGKPSNMSDDTLKNDDGLLDLSFLFEFERRMIWGFPYIYDSQATGWIVWDKQPGVESRGIVTPVEMASTTMRRGFDIVRCMWGGFYRSNGESREPHPTQKPVQVLTPFIEQWTKTTDIILDPFVGSGTTLVACEQLGRQGRGVEIEPKYCAVTLDRLQRLGLEPRRVD